MTDNAARQPKGIPVGGQFAATAHAEPDLVLGLPEQEVHFDADGTEWDWADQGAAILESAYINGVGMRIDTSRSGDGVYSYEIRAIRARRRLPRVQAGRFRNRSHPGRRQVRVQGRTRTGCPVRGPLQHP